MKKINFKLIDALKSALWNDIAYELHVYLCNDLENELRNGLKNGLNTELTNELRFELSNELKNTI